jgi:hypothetical protein
MSTDHAVDCDCIDCQQTRDAANFVSLSERIMQLAIADADIRQAANVEAAKRAVRKGSTRNSEPAPEVLYEYQFCDVSDHRLWNATVYSDQRTPKRNAANSVARKRVTGDCRTRQYVETTTAGMNKPGTERGEWQVKVTLWERACDELFNLGFSPDWIRAYGPRCPRR